MDEEVTSRKPLPLLRWAGSKRAVLPEITKYCDTSSALYVEPFCGSASLFFSIQPQASVLADLNSELISFYRNAKRSPKKVWTIATSLARDEDTYYSARTEFNTSKKGPRKSALFYYLNRNCFNGIYRTNRGNHFNVPYSGKNVYRFPGYADYRRSVDLLQNTILIDDDFIKVVEQFAGPDSFFFLDPPYLTRKKRTFSEYQSDLLPMPEITKIVYCMHLINNEGGKFVCTYDHTEVESFRAVRKWYKGEIQITRNVGGFKSSRKISKEIVFSNT